MPHFRVFTELSPERLEDEVNGWVRERWSMIEIQSRQFSTTASPIENIPVVKWEDETVEGLPSPEEDTIYIVATGIAKIANREGRSDVYAPNTWPANGAIYKDNKVFAVRSLQQF